MSHNDRSRVVTFRLDRAALEVLEWEARFTGIPLRTTIRDMVQQRAEEVSATYRSTRLAPPDTEHREESHGD